MIKDIKSSCLFAASVPATSQAAGTDNGVAVDHSLANSVSYFITAGTFGTSATLDAKLQYSDDNSSWTDEDGASGNDTAVTQLTAAGTAQLNVVNPQGRYSRVVCVVAVEAVVYGVVAVSGPLRTVVPA